MKPLVSVIIAIYNVKPFLEQCINSVINQTLEPIEIILVDDGSNDGSSDICDEYSKKDSRIMVIHQKNSGVSVARNVGILNSSSDWFIMVDGDDWLELDAVEKLYNEACSNDYDIVIGMHYENYRKNEKYIGESVPLNSSYIYTMSTNRISVLSYTLEEVELPELQVLKCNLSSPWAKIYNKSYIIENNILFVPGQKRAQDEVFNMYAMHFAKKIKVVNFPLYHYRIWENSICRKVVAKKVSLDIYDVWHEQILKFIKAFNYENSLFDVYQLYVMNLLTGILKSYVNGLLFGKTSISEVISGLKMYRQRKEFKAVIENFSNNKYMSSKLHIMYFLWKHKMYGMLILVCSLNEYKNKLRNTIKGLRTS